MKPIDSTSSETKGPPKRLVVCCDGTWMDSDGQFQVPSNVTRIARCIKTEGVRGITGTKIPQIVYYQSGVGATNGWISHLVGGMTGLGISENIREAYSFLCNNYNHGDEIFLIGFSRGAFTARSISSLIRCIGLLTRTGLVHLYQIFKDWENQNDPGWISPYPHAPWPNRPNVRNEEYKRELLARELSRFDIKIKACAVWDTVGSLGIPTLGLLSKKSKQRFSFVDTKVEPIIEYAFQALALDEHRKPYSPTIWEKPDGQELPKVLKQCWFPGAHSDVGGGYEDNELSNITLAWMISQLSPLLEFDKPYLLQQQRLNIEHHEKSNLPIRDWGLGYIHKSMTPFFLVAGYTTRTPDDYFTTTSPSPHTFHRSPTVSESSPHSHSHPRRRLRNTNQKIHASVRIRMGLSGLGYNDSPTPYASSCLALQKWRVEDTVAESSGELSNVKWVHETGEKDEPLLVMDEDELGEVELEMIKYWPKVFERLGTLGPGDHSQRRKKSVTYPKDKASARVVNGRVGKDKPDVVPDASDRDGTIASGSQKGGGGGGQACESTAEELKMKPRSKSSGLIV